MNVNFKEKIKELGETPIPLKHAVLAVVITALIIRPPRVWFVTTSQQIHRV